ncbi:helix-turn-helix domain-containing protein [Catenibacterium mitsuokai]|uniref:helix-turn-helix domain-containing protein n=1 Tax=Catenibacterium mitsuokai TaxID=100886 RepID=UPI003F8B0ECE
MNYKVISHIIAIMYIVFMISLFCAAVYLFILIVKALKKYINSKDVREEKKVNAKSLGESLKENRLRCKMTQEFVVETLGVSRQAVSKWENGTSDPNTTNLIALSRLYKVTPADLLKCIQEKSLSNE